MRGAKSGCEARKKGREMRKKGARCEKKARDAKGTRGERNARGVIVQLDSDYL